MASRPPEDEDRSRVKFDKTINLGHVISMIVFMLGLMTSWNIMDKRVLVLEEARSAQREQANVSADGIDYKLRELKESIVELRRTMEKLSDKMGTR